MQPASPFDPPANSPYTGPPGYAWPPGAAPYAPPGHAWPYRAMPYGPGMAPSPLRKKVPAKPFRVIELGALVAMVVGVDVALWHEGAGGGFGLALLFATVPALMFVAVRRRVVTARVAVIGALLLLVAARCVYEATPSVVLSGLALVPALALALRKKRFFLPDLFLSALASIGRFPSRINAVARGVSALVARTRVGNVSLRPILVPVGLVAAFLGVFALANPVVAKALDAVVSAVARVIAFPSPLRVAFWTVTGIVAAVLLRPGVWTTRGTETAKAEGEASTTSVETARNALIGLNALFLGFLGLDAKFLVVGATPAGMTTQDYAHQGAFWLTIALVMLTAVIGLFFRGVLAHDAAAAQARTLAYAWMGQGLVLALATYRRIGIHIAHSGLSDLRIVGILGTTLVVSGVVLVAWKLKHQKTFTWLVRRQLDAFALTGILYAMTSTHALGAAVNVSRVEQGEYRPLLHAFAQSRHASSVATYLPLLRHPDQRVREGVAVLLDDERGRLENDVNAATGWRARDLASRYALARLEAHRAEIQAAMGDVHHERARDVLLQIAHVANEDRSLEEILSVPAAERSDNAPSRGDL